MKNFCYAARRFIRLLVLVGSFAVATTCPAPISDFDKLTIDFTSERDGESKAEWSIPNGNINKDGIGCGEKARSESWIKTKPLPIGLSWRPASGANVRVKISPAPLEIITSSGGEQKGYPVGDVFARYSPDCKHWSSWQQLTRDEKQTTVGVFKGELGVPQVQRKKYEQYIENYLWKRDEPSDDEEALVRLILKKEPDFFEHTLPFIGYIEFLVEPPAFPPWRIKGFEAEVAWGVGGLVRPSIMIWRRAGDSKLVSPALRTAIALGLIGFAVSASWAGSPGDALPALDARGFTGVHELTKVELVALMTKNRPLTPEESANLDRGCPGIVCVYQGLGLTRWPEAGRGTRAYLRLEDAIKRRCPASQENFIFLKQAWWETGRAPIADEATGEISLLSITRAKPGWYSFNYSVYFPSTTTYAWINHREYGWPINLIKPQRAYLSVTPPPLEEYRPAQIYCSTCR